MTDYEKLKAYEFEVFGETGMVTGEFNLDALIDSHRRIRLLNKEYRDNYVSDMQEAHRIGEERGYKEVTNGLYIHRDILKGMTVLELANMIVDWVEQ